jgi:hypothetical protein
MRAPHKGFGATAAEVSFPWLSNLRVGPGFSEMQSLNIQYFWCGVRFV